MKGEDTLLGDMRDLLYLLDTKVKIGREMMTQDKREDRITLGLGVNPTKRNRRRARAKKDRRE